MNIHSLKVLFALTKPIHGRMLLACVMQSVGAVLSIIPFAVVVFLATAIFNGSFDPALALTLTFVVCGAILARIALSMGAATITHFADNAFHYHIRMAMADALRVVPLLRFSKYHSGVLKKKLQDDVGTMHHLIAHFILDIISAVIQPLVIICYLLSFSVPFTCIILITPMLSVAVYVWQMGNFSKHLDAYNAYLMEINSATVELVQGIDAIKIFPRATGVPQRFINATEGFANAFSKWVNGLIPLSSVAEVLVSPLASVTWICLTGFFFVRSAHLEPIFILPFLLVGAGLGTPLITLTNTLSKLQAAAESAEQVTTLLEEPSFASSPSLQTPSGSDVVFDNVTFGYTAGRPALKKISFTIPSGSITALVGPSGAGKSTLAHLLLRFADPQEGKITYGGADLRNIPRGDLGKYIGFVFQDPYLIRASVSDNIRLARPEASDEEILAAARNAQIHERIQACPKGYQSVINEDAQFSGGEMQRIAIARALLADTPVLVLDEPTSHADPLSETALQKAISCLAAHKTLLVIAHRLQTISRADQIIVLDEGVIVERGKHQQLLATQGLYARLWASSELTGKGSEPC